MTTYPTNGQLCDWCDEPATATVLGPYMMNGHSLACDEHAHEHYGIAA